MRFGAVLMLLVGPGVAQTRLDPARIDEAVISKLSAQFGIRFIVAKHLELTELFQTKSQWSLVIAKQPDEESSFEDGRGAMVGAVSFCFVKNGVPDCSEERLLTKYREEDASFVSSEPTFHHLFASDIVFAGPGRTLPLLKIQVCPYIGANGNCGVSTFLFAYDRSADRFRIAFANLTGRNNNEETRFVETGPLLGSVIVVEPTLRAPYVYTVDLYRRVSGGDYGRVVQFRSKTRQGDGNRLAVIDSEMPEILRRLGLWKAGDALPVPPSLPSGCQGLVMRQGLMWCESQ
jgi:hypothetical protein